MFSRRIEHSLNVLMVNYLLEEGVTCPIRCRLSEGIDAIVKYPRNPCGLYVLINEWVGNSIADIIGLTIPKYGQCNLSKSVINATNDNEEIDESNAGRCFFSCYLNGTVPAGLRSQLSPVLNKEIERLLLFDYLVDNTDRHNGNILYQISDKIRLVFIDCSHIMMTDRFNIYRPIKLDEELSNETIERKFLDVIKEDSIYDYLCENVGYCEETLYKEVSDIKQRLTPEILKSIEESVPVEWINGNTSQRINDMFTILEKRLCMIDDIAEIIAGERRKRCLKKY